MRRLSHDFYHRSVLTVAQELLGKTLVFGNFKGIITETEAYGGYEDAASHAFKGPTPRSAIMFGPPGISYVYLIYGLHYCLNIVAEAEGSAAAVLIRGLKLNDRHLNGPGKMCKHLGINKTHQGISLVLSNRLYTEEGLKAVSYQSTPRIGIKAAKDKAWRFVIDPNSL